MCVQVYICLLRFINSQILKIFFMIFLQSPNLFKDFFIWCTNGYAYTYIFYKYAFSTISRSISTLGGFWIKVIIDSRLSARKMSPTSVRQNEGLLSRVYKYGLTLFPTTFEWPRRNPHWGATIVCANFPLYLSFDIAPFCPPLKLRFSVSTGGRWIALLASSYELIAVLRVWNIARRFRQLPRITRSSCLKRI